MSDNRRTYRRIMLSLKQLYPKQLTGRQARHLNTMAAMIAGIVLSKSSQLEQIACKIPDDTQVESRVKRFTRFNQNSMIDAETYFIPFIMPLIAALASGGTVTVAMDGSETGRNCMTLMVSIIYRKRAIPIAWVTVTGKKGHLPEETHVELFKQVQALFPETCHVVFLGDGEFDGVTLLAAIEAAGWEYVCRTAKNRIINDDGDVFALSEMALVPGDCIDIPDVRITHYNYGPVMVLAWWRKGYKEPMYLVTNMECGTEACQWYRRRFRIETCFSDQKSRGFNLQKSHLSDPERIQRFLLAICLAYTWDIYLGVKVRNNNAIMRQIHRTDRCDLSLFQLGLRYLEYLLSHGLSLPFSLMLPA